MHSWVMARLASGDLKLSNGKDVVPIVFSNLNSQNSAVASNVQNVTLLQAEASPIDDTHIANSISTAPPPPALSTITASSNTITISTLHNQNLTATSAVPKLLPARPISMPYIPVTERDRATLYSKIAGKHSGLFMGAAKTRTLTPVVTALAPVDLESNIFTASVGDIHSNKFINDTIIGTSVVNSIANIALPNSTTARPEVVHNQLPLFIDVRSVEQHMALPLEPSPSLSPLLAMETCLPVNQAVIQGFAGVCSVVQLCPVSVVTTHNTSSILSECGPSHDPSHEPTSLAELLSNSPKAVNISGCLIGASAEIEMSVPALINPNDISNTMITNISMGRDSPGIKVVVAPSLKPRFLDPHALLQKYVSTVSVSPTSTLPNTVSVAVFQTLREESTCAIPVSYTPPKFIGVVMPPCEWITAEHVPWRPNIEVGARGREFKYNRPRNRNTEAELQQKCRLLFQNEPALSARRPSSSQPPQTTYPSIATVNNQRVDNITTIKSVCNDGEDESSRSTRDSVKLMHYMGNHPMPIISIAAISAGISEAAVIHVTPVTSLPHISTLHDDAAMEMVTTIPPAATIILPQKTTRLTAKSSAAFALAAKAAATGSLSTSNVPLESGHAETNTEKSIAVVPLSVRVLRSSRLPVAVMPLVHVQILDSVPSVIPEPAPRGGGGDPVIVPSLIPEPAPMGVEFDDDEEGDDVPLITFITHPRASHTSVVSSAHNLTSAHILSVPLVSSAHNLTSAPILYVPLIVSVPVEVVDSSIILPLCPLNAPIITDELVNNNNHVDIATTTPNTKSSSFVDIPILMPNVVSATSIQPHIITTSVVPHIPVKIPKRSKEQPPPLQKLFSAKSDTRVPPIDSTPPTTSTSTLSRSKSSSSAKNHDRPNTTDLSHFNTKNRKSRDGHIALSSTPPVSPFIKPISPENGGKTAVTATLAVTKTSSSHISFVNDKSNDLAIGVIDVPECNTPDMVIDNQLSTIPMVAVSVPSIIAPSMPSMPEYFANISTPETDVCVSTLNPVSAMLAGTTLVDTSNLNCVPAILAGTTVSISNPLDFCIDAASLINTDLSVDPIIIPDIIPSFHPHIIMTSDIAVTTNKPSEIESKNTTATGQSKITASIVQPKSPRKTSIYENRVAHVRNISPSRRSRSRRRPRAELHPDRRRPRSLSTPRLPRRRHHTRSRSPVRRHYSPSHQRPSRFHRRRSHSHSHSRPRRHYSPLHQRDQRQHTGHHSHSSGSESSSSHSSRSRLPHSKSKRYSQGKSNPTKSLSSSVTQAAAHSLSSKIIQGPPILTLGSATKSPGECDNEIALTTNNEEQADGLLRTSASILDIPYSPSSSPSHSSLPTPIALQSTLLLSNTGPKTVFKPVVSKPVVVHSFVFSHNTTILPHIALVEKLQPSPPVLPSLADDRLLDKPITPSLSPTNLIVEATLTPSSETSSTSLTEVSVLGKRCFEDTHVTESEFVDVVGDDSFNVDVDFEPISDFSLKKSKDGSLDVLIIVPPPPPPPPPPYLASAEFLKKAVAMSELASEAFEGHQLAMMLLAAGTLFVSHIDTLLVELHAEHRLFVAEDWSTVFKYFDSHLAYLKRIDTTFADGNLLFFQSLCMESMGYLLSRFAVTHKEAVKNDDPMKADQHRIQFGQRFGESEDCWNLADFFREQSQLSDALNAALEKPLSGRPRESLTASQLHQYVRDTCQLYDTLQPRI